jgi:spermidine/putrescine transport system permease protein
MNSFNDSRISVEWKGFTLKWYFKLFENFAMIESMKNSMLLAFLSAICTCIIATIASFSFYRYKYIGRKIIYFFIQIMIMFPDIILGVSLLFLFVLLNFELGFTTLLISHITLALPFAIITIFAGFKGLDKNTIEVGRDLGASDFNILKRIIIPLILPNILAAFLISLTLSLDDVLVSYFVSGPQFEILPLTIFSYARIGVRLEVNAICTLMLIISIFFIVLSQTLLKGKYD